MAEAQSKWRETATAEDFWIFIFRFSTLCRGTVRSQRAHGSDWGAGTLIGPVYHPVPPVQVFNYFPVRSSVYYTSAIIQVLFSGAYYYFSFYVV